MLHQFGMKLYVAFDVLFTLGHFLKLFRGQQITPVLCNGSWWCWPPYQISRPSRSRSGARAAQAASEDLREEYHQNLVLIYHFSFLTALLIGTNLKNWPFRAWFFWTWCNPELPRKNKDQAQKETTCFNWSSSWWRFHSVSVGGICSNRSIWATAGSSDRMSEHATLGPDRTFFLFSWLLKCLEPFPADKMSEIECQIECQKECQTKCQR